MTTKTPLPALDAVAVNTLKGVGDAMAAKLATLGIFTLQDVLFHLPHRYQDRPRLRRIGELRPGDEGVIEAEVVLSEVVQRKRRSLLFNASVLSFQCQASAAV